MSILIAKIERIDEENQNEIYLKRRSPFLVKQYEGKMNHF